MSGRTCVSALFFLTRRREGAKKTKMRRPVLPLRGNSGRRWKARCRGGPACPLFFSHAKALLPLCGDEKPCCFVGGKSGKKIVELRALVPEVQSMGLCLMSRECSPQCRRQSVPPAQGIAWDRLLSMTNRLRFVDENAGACGLRDAVYRL